MQSQIIDLSEEQQAHTVNSPEDDRRDDDWWQALR
jgi:hypothetical protein